LKVRPHRRLAEDRANPAGSSSRADVHRYIGTVMRHPRRRWSRIRDLKAAYRRDLTWQADGGIVRSGADGAGTPAIRIDPQRTGVRSNPWKSIPKAVWDLRAAAYLSDSLEHGSSPPAERCGPGGSTLGGSCPNDAQSGDMPRDTPLGALLLEGDIYDDGQRSVRR